MRTSIGWLVFLHDIVIYDGRVMALVPTMRCDEMVGVHSVNLPTPAAVRRLHLHVIAAAAKTAMMNAAGAT